MAYTYYQSSAPGLWGTPEYQFIPPPAPTFQPQPFWSGLDYYRAHAAYDNPAFYQSILGRMAVAVGVGFHEARHWHRQIYGGLVNIGQVLPADIGSAAAYEAYRVWKYHHPLYEPLGGDPERQREAMIAMAIAEATHLWQYTGRSFDQYGLQEAAEFAAATASHIAGRVLGIDDDIYPVGSRRLRRSSSFSAAMGGAFASGTPGYLSPSPYAGMNPSPYVGVSPIPSPVPGAAMSYGTPMGGMYGAGGYAGTYPVSVGYPAGAVGGAYGVTPSMYGTGGYPGGMTMGGTAYAPGAYGAGYGYGYGTSAYAGYPGSARAPGPTIIIRRSGHHHHHRSHSTDGYY